MSRLRYAVLAAAVLVSSVAATVVFLFPTGAEGTRSAPAARGAAPSQQPTRQLTREPTWEELDLLHTAREILLRDCMRGKGFVYRPVPRRPIADARDFPLVVDDVGWARRHGYGTDLQRAAEKLQRDDVNQRYFAGLSASRRAEALIAANGGRPEGLTATTPDGMRMSRSPDGCQSQADRSLYRDLPGWFQARTTLTSLTSMVSERTGADPAFARAVRPWSACMRAAGHDFAGPSAVRDALPVPRSTEIRLAVAEATCAQSSGLAETVRRLNRTHETRLRQRYGADVDTAHRLQLAALPRAREVIAAR
ncbi:hypothetical protein [Streptomyces sp. NPDC000410]|uniref:hypothetical protein n=1 Tax=Streptomyces sp. NPDC000410 TaxID=3154254 RepID=UPI00332AF4B6